MKRIVVFIILGLSFFVATSAISAEFIISNPFAFQERFSNGAGKIGLPEGIVLNIGCFIKPLDSPIKEITVKNLDTGLILKPSRISPGGIFSGMYLVFPMPAFDPGQHLGVWEFRVKDQSGKETTEKTHKLEVKKEMPFVEAVKASGNPLAPTLKWMAPAATEIPEGVKIKYQVRLLMAGNKQFYRSGGSTLTEHSIPEGIIKSEDLSKIYVRIQCQGWDANDREHFFPLELQSSTILPLTEIMEKK
jgi:hypothetical protein